MNDTKVDVAETTPATAEELLQRGAILVSTAGGYTIIETKDDEELTLEEVLEELGVDYDPKRYTYRLASGQILAGQHVPRGSYVFVAEDGENN